MRNASERLKFIEPMEPEWFDDPPTGMECSGGKLVPPDGIEPPTFGLQNRCSTS